ncbi:MAG: hypothetical protein NVS4B1_00070 [Ktedonobacteraceae bacterium]
MATPSIWNSDQGSHFTSPQYRDLLLAANVRISMDGKGRALDKCPNTMTFACYDKQGNELLMEEVDSN